MYQAKPAQALANLPEGPQGIRETLKIMRDWVRAFRADPTVREKAAGLVFYIPRSHRLEQLKAIFDWVKTNVRYIKDPNGVEMLHWPTQVMSQGFGDCDDHATLVAALAESVGIPTRLVAIGFEPGYFSHVYAEAAIGAPIVTQGSFAGDGWVTLDTTEPDKPMGWRPPGIVSAYISRV